MPTVTDTPAPPVEKPKRKARKPRAPKGATTTKAPRKPARTLAAWLREKGEAHVEAARVLGAPFREHLRAALVAESLREKAHRRALRLEKALAKANEDYALAVEAQKGALRVLSHLDTTADFIAKQRAASTAPATPPAASS